MDNKSRTGRIILIILGISVACAVVCLVAFFLLGGVSIFSANRIVMGTAIQNQQPEPPAEVVVQEPAQNVPTEPPTPSPQATPTITPNITLTPFPPTATPPLPAVAACVPANERDKAIVVKVLDGASIQVVMQEKTYTVRYIGIHAPIFGLKSEPFGPEAANLNKTLVQDQVVTLVMDTTDKNEAGDLLRYVFAGDRFVNLEMVRQGFAQAVSAPPDINCDADFLQAQQSAQQEHLGQWKDFVATGIPTLTPTIDLTASPTSQVAAGPCDCKGPDLDCADFATRADAQVCYVYCKKLGFGDIFLIDIDHDGYACINKRP
jgi:micrococcal nuclease